MAWLPAERLSAPNLLEVLLERAAHTPDRPLFTFLRDGTGEDGNLTCSQLADRALSLGGWLTHQGLSPGDRVILTYPAGLQFVVAVFACFAAGLVAVPAPPPEPGRMERSLPRLRAIVGDCQAAAILTTSELVPLLGQLGRVLTHVDLPAGERNFHRLKPEDLAYLQYTSGSTSSPKGVMISHANVLANSRYIQVSCGYTESSRALVWVPGYHDDGLVQGRLQPVFSGFHCYLMPPQVIASRPLLWLQTISERKITHAGGPNFTYDRCLSQAQAADLKCLSLESWEVAYNAAERIQPETLRRFFEAFKGYGFKWQSYTPAYGLAESTLMVTIARGGPRMESLQPSSDFVGCGRTFLDTTVVVVDPEACTARPDGEIGEIWISGSSVGGGYWNQPELTLATFQAHLSDGRGPFLRTGDLGFLRGGELYVTGRLKDLLIVGGVNHYPEDLEWTVQQCHPAIRRGFVAAFTQEIGGEQPVVVAQTRTTAELERVALEILRAVACQQGLALSRIVLIARDQLPKTSSGKIQRNRCRQMLLQGELDAIFEYVRPAWQPTLEVAPGQDTRIGLQDLVARLLGLESQHIPIDRPFAQLGLDSVARSQLGAWVEAWRGHRLPSDFLWLHDSVERAAEALEAGLYHQDTVLLRSGAGPALYVLPSIRGTFLWTRDMLEHWGNGPAVVGLRQVHTSHQEHTVEEVAAEYVRALSREVPTGRLRLAGYSYACRYAYEAARQLVGRGREVEFLGLVDGVPGRDEDVTPARLLGMLPALARWVLAEARRGSWPPMVKAARWLARWLLARLGWPRPFRFSEHWTLAERRAFEQARAFVARPCDLRIALFRRRGFILSALQQEGGGWQELTARPVRTIEVPGDHSSMIHHPNAVYLAREMLAELNREEIS
jgi:acyl-CoA synthetase (AMP-forming)/AMP-acid ligase II/thioesterase domain-containing protein